MTTFPTAAQLRTYGGSGPWVATTRAARLRNAGYAQAVFNVASMQTAGLDVPFVWVDVEPYRRTRGRAACWPTGRSSGASCGPTRTRGTGSASTRTTVAGGPWSAACRKPAYPAWVPVGPVARGLSVATARCARPSFSGGPVLLAQWVQDARDRDVTCVRLTGLAPRQHPLTALLGTSWGPGASGPAVATCSGGWTCGLARDRTLRRADPAGGAGVPGEPGVPAHRRGHRPRAARAGRRQQRARQPQPDGPLLTPY